MKASDIKPEECDTSTYDYIKMVPEGEFFQQLGESSRNVITFFMAIPRELHDYRYAQNKWTIKDVLQHMIDVERIFAYRILRFGRGDSQELTGFDVDDYGSAAHTVNRNMLGLIREYEILRESTVMLLKTIGESNFINKGMASGHLITVRAMAFKLVGHDLHHCYMVEKNYLRSDAN